MTKETMKTAKELIESVRQSSPEIAIATTWEIDPHYVWDGDGPDPADDGYLPHVVTVSASKIVDGEIVTGEAYLGGSYTEPGDYCPEVHGYFPDMLEEALQELQHAIANHEV